VDATVKYFSKKFMSEESSQKAFIKLCKWIDEHILSDKVLKETHFHIDKYWEDGLYVCKLSLFAPLPDEESRESFCNSCKEFHKRFYINHQFNCDRCNMKARTEDIQQRLIVKKEYRKEILKRRLKS